MNRLFSYFALVALTGIGLAGCYPGGAVFTEDLDVVYTNFNDEYDFQSQSTYAMPDSIVIDVKTNTSGVVTYEYMDDSYARPILARIEANMTSYGWSRVPVTANPDVLLAPAGISSTNYFFSFWHNWWFGGIWGGWGWYFPPSFTVSSFTTGSFIMVIADPDNDSPINRSPTGWIGAMNGILNSRGNLERVFSGIDVAFNQSPYLKIN